MEKATEALKMSGALEDDILSPYLSNLLPCQSIDLLQQIEQMILLDVDITKDLICRILDVVAITVYPEYTPEGYRWN